MLLSHSMEGHSAGSGYTGRRGDLMLSMFEYFQELGVELDLNANVKKFFETDHSAGFTVNGQRWEADAVICVDGAYSAGRHFVLGKERKISHALVDIPTMSLVCPGVIAVCKSSDLLDNTARRRGHGNELDWA